MVREIKLEIPLDCFTFKGIEGKNAIYGIAHTGECLRDKVLMVSDFPDGRFRYVELGACRYLVIRNETAESGFHEFRIVGGLVIGMRGASEYLLDKEGNAFLAPADQVFMFLSKESLMAKGYEEIIVENSEVFGMDCGAIYLGNL